jgi:hydroxymethylpyrimidine pyrophosphatase-like HAD family hydrolase
MFTTRGGGNAYLPVFKPTEPEQAYGYNQHQIDQSGAFSQSMQAPAQHPQYVTPYHNDFDLSHQPINQCDNPSILPQTPQQTSRKKKGKIENDLREQLSKKQKTEQPTSQEYEPTTSIPDIEAEILKRGLSKENVRQRIARKAGLTTNEVEAMGLHPYTLEPDPSTW